MQVFENRTRRTSWVLIAVLTVLLFVLFNARCIYTLAMQLVAMIKKAVPSRCRSSASASNIDRSKVHVDSVRNSPEPPTSSPTRPVPRGSSPELPIMHSVFDEIHAYSLTNDANECSGSESSYDEQYTAAVELVEPVEPETEPETEPQAEPQAEPRVSKW